MASTSYGAINEECLNQHYVRKHSYFQRLFAHRATYMAAMFAFLHIVNLGLSVSYTAPTGDQMMAPQSRVHATPEDISWIASIGAISWIVGGCISGFLLDPLGRKALLIYTSLPFLISWLMVGYGTSISWIYAGRFITGFCCGLVSVVVPTYVVEISTKEIRGLLGAWFNVAFAIGVLMSMTLGAVLTWSWLAVSGGILSCISALAFVFMPESPHWLITHGYKHQALDALKFLRVDSEEANEEYSNLSKTLEYETNKILSLKEFLDPVCYKPTFLSVGLMFFQQFCGANALISYTVEIFKRSESTLDPSIATIIVSVTQLLSTLISSMLMDKAGRKVLFVLSGSFCCLGLMILGGVGRLIVIGVVSQQRFGWAPVLGFVIFVAAFNLGFGPVPWVMAPEMVSINARSTVVGITTVSSGLFMFIVIKTFDQMRISMEDYGVYIFYGIISLAGSFFCFLLPETKGKSLQEIQSYFRS